MAFLNISSISNSEEESIFDVRWINIYEKPNKVFGVIAETDPAESRNTNRKLLSWPQHHRRSVARSYKRRRQRCLGEKNSAYEYYKPLSRKKRFRRMKKNSLRRLRSAKSCLLRRHHRRLHPRWIPMFDDEEEVTTRGDDDSRVMSVRHLIELSEDGDGTLDDIIPREVHYVVPVISVVSDKLSFPRSPAFQPNCTTDEDCGLGALCVVPQGQRRSDNTDQHKHRGYCYCRPEYYGDGFNCTKIPSSYHRDKRIKRELDSRLGLWNIRPLKIAYNSKIKEKLLNTTFSDRSSNIPPTKQLSIN